ncbi:MAG TPA: hypothetical protein PKD51_06140 [Saprospiraceae bacterium]|nr:hypothetical protein [Saprospiraceae bacterium]HMU02818.1 hypothetical protein [Saprospiraceae bacterium]
MAFFEVLGEWEEKPHDAWERDGVAPQCAIPGLDWNVPASGKYGRIRFQGQADFVQAHVGSSYRWVISGLSINQPGYVKSR